MCARFLDILDVDYTATEAEVSLILGVVVTTTLLCSQGVSLIYTWNKRERKRRRDLLAELSLVTLSKTEKRLPESAFFS